MRGSPIKKEIERLQEELGRFDSWTKTNPTKNLVANTERAKYRIIIETAIKKLGANKGRK